MKKRIRGIVWILSICLSLFLLSNFTIFAGEIKETGIEKAVVFVLDTSGSMQGNDADYLALDSIQQMIYTFPMNIQSGIVTYGEEAQVQLSLETMTQDTELLTAMKRVEYKGYSNAGAGLHSAVEMLLGTEAQEKYVVLLSDGEILMGTDEATEQSALLYQEAAAQAQNNGIEVHVIGLGEDMADRTNSIYAAAEKTAGRSYYAEQSEDIQKIVDELMQKEWEIKQSTVAIIEADGELEQMSVDLPYAHADKVRIILTGNAPMESLKANFQAEAANQINGRRYSVIELTRPFGKQLDISFKAEEGAQLRVNVQAEYQVTPIAEIAYHDVVPAATGATYYERSAEVSCQFYRKDNQGIRLWEEDYFQHAKIYVTTNTPTMPAEDDTEVRTVLPIENGTITVTEPVEQEETYVMVLDYSALPVNVIGNHTIQLTLEAPPLLPVEEPEPEPEPPYLIIISGVIALIVIVILLIIWYQKTHKKPEPIPEDRPEPGKYSYVGKLNLYVTRTQSGYDIPPLSYNLFRLPSGKVVSLKEVLESCDVQERFEGAEKIYLKAGANRSLLLTNHSDCTVMKGREILMKRKSCQLLPDAKIDITFEDEISELTFQYKDLKPSEMW